MREQTLFESELFEDESESDEWGGEFEFEEEEEEEEESEQDWDVRVGPQKSCCKACGKRLRRRRRAGRSDSDDEMELSRFIPSWVNVAKKLYDAGRLGWKAGRWLDKQSGRIFGKKISQKGAEFLYKRFGRSRRLEEFVDSLPGPVRKWLYSL